MATASMSGHQDRVPVASSVWAVRLAVFSAALVLSGIVFHRIFSMPTPVALNLFLLAFAGSAIAIVVALLALFRIWRGGYHGTANALAGILVACAVLGWPLGARLQVVDLPTINDVTTDPQRPPQFNVLARSRPPGANKATYPGQDTAKLQEAAYGDLRTLSLGREPEEMMLLVERALRRLKMNIVSKEPYSAAQRRPGIIEASDRTLVIGFYDDIVVRISGRRGQARVDVRSASRFGRHDFGRNADRVRQILKEIIARVQATTPEQLADELRLARERKRRKKKVKRR